MIPQKYLGLIEMAFTFVVVAGFTIQQLWSLRDAGPKKPGESGDSTDESSDQNRDGSGGEDDASPPS